MSSVKDSITIDRGLAQNVEKIHGVNPVFLIDKILREKILDSLFWKKHCFLLDILELQDLASEVEIIGTYDNNQNSRATDYICLLLKMLQLQPKDEIVIYMLTQPYFKYVTALAALYIRLVFPSVRVYQLLEPLLNDYRKLRIRKHGNADLTYVDQLVDELLAEEKFCGLTLPRLVNRLRLEDDGLLDPRESELQSELENEEDDIEG
ncbi:hypothetical protein LJB42_001502 [Komagataella kurtzmanii]|nr:hypothetical protein LJB42_001502 [Komagataella kurtzmanii]